MKQQFNDLMEMDMYKDFNNMILKTPLSNNSITSSVTQKKLREREIARRNNFS